MSALSSMLVDAGWFAAVRDRERTDAVFGAMARELRRRCDDLLDRGSPRYCDMDDLDSFWWRTRIGSKQLVVATWDLAMAGVAFDNTAYREAAVRMLLNLAEHAMAEQCRGTCYSYEYRSWMQFALDIGHAAESLGASYDLVRPYLSEDPSRRVGTYLRKLLDAEGGFIESEGGPRQLNFQNMPVIGRLGSGVLAVALERAGLIDAGPHVETARHAALQYLDHGGHEDGILPEGPMYGCAVLKHIAVLGSILKGRGDDAIWASGAWDRIVDGLAAQIIPGEGLPNPLNDCYSPRVTSWLLDAARQRRSGLARWLWETMVRPLGEARWDAPVPWNDIRAPWWNGLLPHAMASYDPAVAPRSPEACGVPLRRHVVSRGIIDDRTGWGDQDWYLSVTCLPDQRWRNRRGSLHRQADRGHFALYAFGEQFAIDSGYGNEPLAGTTEVLRSGHTGEAHNVPEIGGEMQQGCLYARGVSDVVADAWARLVRVEFGECYSNCVRAARTFVVVPDENGDPLYVAIHDSVVPRYPVASLGLYLHTHEQNEVRLVDRETADLVGGVHGNRCRVVTTAMAPGRFAVDRFCGHARLHYQVQGGLNAITLMVPYRRDEPAPVVEKIAGVGGDGGGKGYAVRLQARGVTDVLMVCAEGSIAAYGCESDAEFAIVRMDGGTKAAVVDGTAVRVAGQAVFSAEQRSTGVAGPPPR